MLVAAGATALFLLALLTGAFCWALAQLGRRWGYEADAAEDALMQRRAQRRQDAAPTEELYLEPSADNSQSIQPLRHVGRRP